MSGIRAILAAAVTLLAAPLSGCCLSSTGEGTGGASGSASGGGTGAGSGGASGGGASGGASCLRDAGVVTDELGGCQTDADCDCPLGCVLDSRLAVRLCERPCRTTGDCPLLETACAGGTCAPVPCGPRFGSALDAVCAWDDAGMLGTCLPTGASTGLAGMGGAVGLCSEGGNRSYTEVCDPGVSRAAGLGGACTAGTVCALGGCLQACDPSGAPSCGAQVCEVFDPDVPSVGVCRWEGDAGSCGSAGASCLWYFNCCSGNCNAGRCN